MCSYKRVVRALVARMRARGSFQEVPEAELLVRQLAEDTAFGAPVIRAALNLMQADNLILLADGYVFFIS